MCCVVIAFVLVSALGALTASNSLLHGTVLSVAAQTAPASSHTTVSNNVSVFSDSVSLGSSLHVEGVVTTPKGPLASVPVALHMGDIIVARTQTDARGKYAFSAPVGLNYVPAVLSGSATVYTVAESTNTSFPAAPSAVTNVPVNVIPAYGIIAVVTGVVVLGLYVYTRAGTQGRLRISPRLAAPRQWLSSWTSRRAPRQNERQNERTGAAPQKVPEPASSVDLVASSATEAAGDLLRQAPVAEHAPAVGDTELATEEGTEAAPQEVPEQEPAREVAEETSIVKRANDLFAEGMDRQAISALYNAAVESLAKACGLALSPSMTHWETYAVLQEAVPDARASLRTLTEAYERTAYAGKSLTVEQRAAAIEACKTIHQYAMSRASSP